jgi:ABC-type transporter Mla MlaB component
MAAQMPRSVRLAIRGPLERTDLPGLSERTCRLLERVDAKVLLCDVSGLEADAVALDALARLALAARRSGCRVCLLGASTELRSLAAFVGIAEAIGA